MLPSPQVSLAQQQRIVNYLAIGQAEGAKVLTGGAANDVVSAGAHIELETGGAIVRSPLSPALTLS